MTLIRNPQAWAKRSKVMSLNIDETTSRYSCVLSLLYHHPIIPMLQTPTYKLFKVPHLPHLHCTPKDWSTSDNRYMHSRLPNADEILINFPKPVWTGQATKQDWGKIFQKLRPPGSPSFCIICWRMGDTLKTSNTPLKCLPFQRATRKPPGAGLDGTTRCDKPSPAQKARGGQVFFSRLLWISMSLQNSFTVF